jgi:DNA-binding PucR family transcriptional regulator
MNIKELITDLRARINPQYYDQIGTESYERHQVVKALEYLQQENEQLRKDAEIGAAINRASEELPDRYIVGISVEKDAATVDLAYPSGHIKTMDVDGDNRLAAEINAAIDAARGGR